jgi:hypothetical protein
VALRETLIRKARRGQWDPRMCTAHGVSPRVNEGCRQFIVRGYAALLVPTSTLRTPVGGGSHHQARNSKGEGRAVDLGHGSLRISAAESMRRKRAFQRAEHEAFVDGRRPRMLELLGPNNELCVLRGRQVDLIEDTPLERQHDTHVHAAFED